MLLKINERGRWTDPPSEDHKIRAQQDEEIFQTARLVKYAYAFPSVQSRRLADTAFSCGHFMSLIFGDYVAGFLGISGKSYCFRSVPIY